MAAAVKAFLVKTMMNQTLDCLADEIATHSQDSWEESEEVRKQQKRED